MEILGIVIAALVAIGVAIYQVKANREDNSFNTKSNSAVWNQLQVCREFFAHTIWNDMEKTGHLHIEPVQELFNMVRLNKLNFSESEYKKLEKFCIELQQKVNIEFLDEARVFLERKAELFPNEIEDESIKLKKRGNEIANCIESFMKNELG